MMDYLLPDLISRFLPFCWVTLSCIDHCAWSKPRAVNWDKPPASKYIIKSSIQFFFLKSPFIIEFIVVHIPQEHKKAPKYGSERASNQDPQQVNFQRIFSTFQHKLEISTRFSLSVSVSACNYGKGGRGGRYHPSRKQVPVGTFPT